MSDPIAEMVSLHGDPNDPRALKLAKQIRQQVGRELLERIDNGWHSVTVENIREVCQIGVSDG